jgi:hypothetical protein
VGIVDNELSFGNMHAKIKGPLPSLGAMKKEIISRVGKEIKNSVVILSVSRTDKAFFEDGEKKSWEVKQFNINPQ